MGDARELRATACWRIIIAGQAGAGRGAKVSIGGPLALPKVAGHARPSRYAVAGKLLRAQAPRARGVGRAAPNLAPWPPSETA